MKKLRRKLINFKKSIGNKEKVKDTWVIELVFGFRIMVVMWRSLGLFIMIAIGEVFMQPFQSKKVIKYYMFQKTNL